MNDDEEIDEWLMMPSSDISEDELFPEEEEEDELVFDRVFNDQIEKLLSQDDPFDINEISKLHDEEELRPDDEVDEEGNDPEDQLDTEVVCGSGAEVLRVHPSTSNDIDYTPPGKQSRLVDGATTEDTTPTVFYVPTVPNLEEVIDDPTIRNDPYYIPPGNQVIIDETRSRGRGKGVRRGVRTRGERRRTQDACIQTRGRRGGRGRGRIPPEPESDWQKIPFVAPNIVWEGNIPNPPKDCELMTPYDYFTAFIPDDLIEMLVEQTNVYATQNGYELNASKSEIMKFIGILLYTGIAPMPQYRMYWANETRFPPIADIMPRGRFEKLLKYFHVVNNETRVPGDKLFKVRPLLNALVEVCRNLPSDQNQSVDEHMIPFKGTSHIKQYVKKKPKKWGYKVFIRCGSSGLMHDFSVYIGKDTCPNYDLGFSGDIVVELCTDLPENKGHLVYCDNWFSSIKLFRYMKKKIHTKDSF